MTVGVVEGVLQELLVGRVDARGDVEAGADRGGAGITVLGDRHAAHPRRGRVERRAA